MTNRLEEVYDKMVEEFDPMSIPFPKQELRQPAAPLFENSSEPAEDRLHGNVDTSEALRTVSSVIEL